MNACHREIRSALESAVTAVGATLADISDSSSITSSIERPETTSSPDRTETEETHESALERYETEADIQRHSTAAGTTR
jgi:hypothetical protein